MGSCRCAPQIGGERKGLGVKAESSMTDGSACGWALCRRSWFANPVDLAPASVPRRDSQHAAAHLSEVSWRSISIARRCVDAREFVVCARYVIFSARACRFHASAPRELSVLRLRSARASRIAHAAFSSARCRSAADHEVGNVSRSCLTHVGDSYRGPHPRAWLVLHAAI